jgi:hypothetical protein
MQQVGGIHPHSWGRDGTAAKASLGTDCRKGPQSLCRSEDGVATQPFFARKGVELICTDRGLEVVRAPFGSRLHLGDVIVAIFGLPATDGKWMERILSCDTDLNYCPVKVWDTETGEVETRYVGLDNRC